MPILLDDPDGKTDRDHSPDATPVRRWIRTAVARIVPGRSNHWVGVRATVPARFHLGEDIISREERLSRLHQRIRDRG